MDVNTEAYGLQDSFVEDLIDDPLEFRAMVEACIEIEDNEHIIEAEVEEAIEVLEAINERVDEKQKKKNNTTTHWMKVPKTRARKTRKTRITTL